jgi:hypothetical protein
MSVKRAGAAALGVGAALSVAVVFGALALDHGGIAMLISTALGNKDLSGSNLGGLNNMVGNLTGYAQTAAFVLGPLGLAVAAGCLFLGSRRGLPILLTVVGAVILAAMSPTIAS